VQHANDTGLSDAAMNLEAPGGETLSDNPGCALLLEAELWISMKISPDRDELVQVGRIAVGK
jgi:hypothetical protein